MHLYPAPPPAASGSFRSPGLTSDLELPHPAIAADNDRDYVFTWLHPMQGQGEVGVRTCWNHVTRVTSLDRPFGGCSP